MLPPGPRTAVGAPGDLTCCPHRALPGYRPSLCRQQALAASGRRAAGARVPPGVPRSHQGASPRRQRSGSRWRLSAVQEDAEDADETDEDEDEVRHRVGWHAKCLRGGRVEPEGEGWEGALAEHWLLAQPRGAVHQGLCSCRVQGVCVGAHAAAHCSAGGVQSCLAGQNAPVPGATGSRRTVRA